MKMKMTVRIETMKITDNAGNDKKGGRTPADDNLENIPEGTAVELAGLTTASTLEWS